MANPRRQRLRWELADEPAAVPGAQGALFEEPVFDRRPGIGEYRGLEFLHVKAHRIINEVKGAPFGFRYSINAYRGCSHACTYCAVGETPVLMADGRTKTLADLRAGDWIYGTVRRGSYRRYVPTEVLDHWFTGLKPAYRVTLEDGTELVTSGDHRFLTGRGWKHVVGEGAGLGCRPHLTTNNSLLGVGRFAESPKATEDYKRGYLCGMIRGDAHLGSHTYTRASGKPGIVHMFRLALVDFEPLQRTKGYLEDLGIGTDEFLFHQATDTHKEIRAIRTQARANVQAIRDLIAWPSRSSDDWAKGFLAGIFDAEGSFGQRILRISNGDDTLIDEITACLDQFGFRYTVEDLRRPNRMRNVRLDGGLVEKLRFFHTVDPATTRKRTIDDVALKSNARLGVTSIEALGIDLPMYDITTGTGDFIADGVVSHNCFARPTHEYLELDADRDFETKIVVKVNAASLLERELRSPRWAGESIAMGTNTDPYQRAEGKYRLTQRIVEVLTERENPFSILTKSTLVQRDLGLLTRAAERGLVRVNFSIPTLDEGVWRATEPGTPHPLRRIRAVERFNEAGVPCGVLIAPVLPHLSDHPDQLAEVVRACVDAGARSISAGLLHLRAGVQDVFLSRLAETHPDLVDRYSRQYRNRVYAPRVDQEALSSLVRDLVRKHGGPSAETEPSPRPALDPTAATTGGTEPEAREPAQLSLL